MLIHNLFIINRAGSLIYDYDNRLPPIEIEITFTCHPVDFKFDVVDNKLTVTFGERNSVRQGFVLTSINNETLVTGGRMEVTREDAMQIMDDPLRYPLTLKFSRPVLNTNEKIILSSMFHSIHAITAQLSPVSNCSGIDCLETDTYRLHCYQTLTGIKFVVIADHSAGPVLDQLLMKLYELYADYACKNPFYSLEMPVRCELFDTNVKAVVEKYEKSGVLTV